MMFIDCLQIACYVLSILLEKLTYQNATSPIHIELIQTYQGHMTKRGKTTFILKLFCSPIFSIKTTVVAILNIFKSSLFVCFILREFPG